MIVYPLMNSSNIVLSATIPNATILQDMQLSQNCNVDMQLFQHCNVDMQLSQTCNPAIKTSIAYPLGFGTKPYQTTGSPTREAQHVLDIRMPPDPRCWDSENTVVSRHQTWRAGKSTMKIHHIQKYGWHFTTFKNMDDIFIHFSTIFHWDLPLRRTFSITTLDYQKLKTIKPRYLNIARWWTSRHINTVMKHQKTVFGVWNPCNPDIINRKKSHQPSLITC